MRSVLAEQLAQITDHRCSVQFLSAGNEFENRRRFQEGTTKRDGQNVILLSK
jgi:hypothetical protein